MAKIGDRLTPNNVTKAFKKVSTVRPNQPGLTCRFTTKPNKVFRTNAINFVVKHKEMRDAWARLSGWKKFRWSLCAWRKGIASAPPTGYTGWSGITLYYQCRIDQATPPNKQPVSPCSTRATDPGASPWDYQP